MNILIDKITNTEGCYVIPPSGQPPLNPGHELPQDLIAFYQFCGGIKFFVDSDYPMEIVAPDQMLLSNPLILPEGWQEDIAENDISNDWYVIAQAGPEQRISIDLNKSRIGKCYDSFWDIHASPGECPVVALSFTELLERILECKGGHWFWLADEFVGLGDAYD